MPDIPGIRRIIRCPRLPSTQTLARKLADEGAQAWTLVWADRQTRGRGRMDRRWISGAGGLFFSLILRPRLTPADLPRMSLEAGRACATALAGVSGVETLVKFPNDVLARSSKENCFRKVCGILIEASGTSRQLGWVVVGIGVNVNNRIPKSLRQQAVSLADLRGQELPVEIVLRRLARELRKIWKVT